jgi:glycosyltransferase involved in cell wall biosynthesis
VVPTDSGGPLELVRDGVTGVVVDPKPRAVAAAFDRLAADHTRAEAMGAAGREHLEATVPSWPEVVARLLA